MVIDVIDRRSQDLGFQPLQNFRRRLRMSAPFDFQFQVMGSDTAFALLVANPPVNQCVHAMNQVVGSYSRLWIDGATATLRLSTAPFIGIRTVSSVRSISFDERPVDSGPTMRAQARIQSTSV